MTWRVDEITERAQFVSMAPEWNRLVQKTHAGPFLKHSFLRIWLDNFAPREHWRVLVARDGKNELKAALPLLQGWGKNLLPVPQLVSASNPHSCRFDILSEHPRLGAQAFWSHLTKDSRWSVMLLKDIPAQGNGWALALEAQDQGCPVGTWVSMASPYIRLPKTWGEMEGRLSSKFRANLRRRWKKLEEQGNLTFERYTSGELLDARLEEGFELEASGWKGKGGTAIWQDAATWGFYRELARQLAEDQELSLSFLRLNGRAVAFHYGLLSGQTYYLLKPGFDESHRDCSPGQLLMEKVIKDCVERGATELDFLGPDMGWKRDWTDAVRVHTWLFVFKDNPLGRALRRAKFEWAPKMRERMVQWTA